MRVFIIESPNPKDLLENRSEAEPLKYICHAMGHEVYSFLIRSHREFIDTCDYISSMDEGNNRTPKEPLCIHISSHGNDEGVVFGSDFLQWGEVAEGLNSILTMGYKNDIFLIVSACGTNKQKISQKIKSMNQRNSKIKPPKYILLFDKESVNWDDAILSWTIIYHQIHRIDHNKKSDVMSLLDRIKVSEFGDLAYKRWDGEKYINYSPNV
ncbi:hypothetical protein MKZ15_06265 [Paenibacillus sp. FSL R7-0216]|uniref:hypothetical protein n=1 Tax=Paenibacillus sp. FSL R7-0216 TaxID=2921677 RepID=UPI0030D85F29